MITSIKPIIAVQNPMLFLPVKFRHQPKKKVVKTVCFKL